MSRWRHWSNTVDKPGFSSFLKEAGEVNNIIPTQDPKAYAQQQGWEAMPFGYYRDPKTGQVVARSVEGQLMAVNGQEGGGEAAPQDRSTPLDTGNPAVTSGQTPADRARQLGLQSDGRGGYRDSSGNLAARTVNNELVFYDENGGVVSDGGGGMHLALSQPSWVDPTTGLIITPPAQPETPGEMAAVPDPTPAQPPQGYHSFIQKRKIEMYASAKRQEKINQDIMSKEEEVNAAYESHPMLSMLKQSLDETIAKAEETGDEQKLSLANRLRDKVNDSAETNKAYFDQIPEEQHKDLADALKKYMVQQCKREYFEDSEMSTQLDQAIKQEDWDTAKELSKNNGVPEQYKKIIDEMMDEVTGYNDVDLFYNSSDETKVIDGGKIKYYLEPFRSSDYDQQQLEQIKRAAHNVGNEYGVSAPQGALDITWGTKEDSGEMDTDNKKRAALDALKSWRTSVLPTLTPGTLLRNNPSKGGRGGNQRERLYIMAGFGSANEQLGGQYGVVVDENGQNVVKPLEFDNEVNERYNNRLRRTAEPLWEANLNTSQQVMFIEAIINGL